MTISDLMLPEIARSCLKPQIRRNVTATRKAIEDAFGPKIGQLFVPNPMIVEYATVLRFPSTKVVVSGELARALRKQANSLRPLLIIAHDLTVEARHTAIEEHCDVLTLKEFGWTDDRYQAIRQQTS